MTLRRPVLVLLLGLAWTATALGAWWIGRQGHGAAAVTPEAGRTGTSVGVRPPLIVQRSGATTTTAEMSGAAEAMARPVRVETAADKLRRASEAKDPLERLRHLMDALTTLGPGDGDKVREFLENLPPGGMARLRDVPLILNAWARVDGPGAVTYALTNYQDRSGRWMAGSALQGWASADPAAALAFAEDIRAEGGGPNPYVAGVLTGWAQENAGAVAQYLAGLPEAERDRYLRAVSQTVIGQGQETAWNWALSITDPAMQAAAFGQVVEAFAGQNPAAMAARLLPFAGQDFAAPALAALAGELARQSGLQAIAFVEGLPVGEAREQAEAIAIREWARQDVQAAGEWLAAQPQVSNDALAVYARQVVREDPAAALEWARAIDNPAQQMRTTIAVGQTWFRQDPAAAGAWAATSGLPAEAVQQVLNPPPLRRRGGPPMGGGGGPGGP